MRRPDRPGFPLRSKRQAPPPPRPLRPLIDPRNATALRRPPTRALPGFGQTPRSRAMTGGSTAGPLEEVAAQCACPAGESRHVRLTGCERAGRENPCVEEMGDGDGPLVVPGEIGLGAALRPARIEEQEGEERLAGVVEASVGEPEILWRRIRRRAGAQERGADRGEEVPERAWTDRWAQADPDAVRGVDGHGAGTEWFRRAIVLVDAHVAPRAEVEAQLLRPAAAGAQHLASRKRRGEGRGVDEGEDVVPGKIAALRVAMTPQDPAAQVLRDPVGPAEKTFASLR